MVKSIKSILIGIIIGALVVFAIYKSDKTTSSTENADVIIDRIESVKKIIVTEGYFSEIYSYKEADRYFYNYIEFEKKAIL